MIRTLHYIVINESICFVYKYNYIEKGNLWDIQLFVFFIFESQNYFIE